MRCVEFRASRGVRVSACAFPSFLRRLDPVCGLQASGCAGCGGDRGGLRKAVFLVQEGMPHSS